MDKKILSLKEVSEDIGETLGEVKQFDVNHGYYNASFRGTKEFERVDTKIRKTLSFKGRKQPISFGFFKSKKGYTSRYKNSKDYANHYGEYIAYIVLKQLGKKACKVDLGQIVIKHPHTHQDIVIDGILSHSQLSQEESFIPIASIISRYKTKLKNIDNENSQTEGYMPLIPKGKTNSEKNYTNIEVVLKSLELYYKENGQEEKLPMARKQFFDMCIFDIKFANRDRHDENFGEKVNQSTGDIQFYHLFDNEQILGMQEERETVGKLINDEEEYKRFKGKELTSCIGIPGTTQKIEPMELLNYLLKNYYDETMDSISDIGRYKIEDLEEVMDICPGLSDEHKKFAKKIFLEREKEIEKVITEHNKNKETNDEPSLV